MTTTECLSSTSYRWDRQTNWIDGDYRHTLYDHYLTPNSTTYDCLRGPMHGWRTARSRHPGGVNILFADGSVHFIKNSINLAAWQAIATVAGGEVVSSRLLLKRGEIPMRTAWILWASAVVVFTTPAARAHELWFHPRPGDQLRLGATQLRRHARPR